MFENNSLRQRCYTFSISLIGCIDKLPKERSAYIIADQLLRAGTSIDANLVEATASSSRLEYKKFFEISLKSADETKYWLGLLRDTNKSDIKVITALLKEAIEISNMIGSAVIKLKRKTII